MSDFFTQAEQIVDSIGKMDRPVAIAMVAEIIRTAWTDGFTLGTRSTAEAQCRMLDLLLNPNPNREVQRDHDEEREHGWSV